MSLKEKCLQLKEEVFNLKKKAKEPPKAAISPRELRDILFAKEKNTIADEIRTSYRSAKNIDISTSRFTSNRMDNYDTTTSTHFSYAQHRSIKREVSDIKRVTEVPREYISQIRERMRDNSFSGINISNFESPIRKQIDQTVNEENHEKRKQVILLSRYLKEKEDKKYTRANKENFADACKKLYNQKRKDDNLQREIKELVSRRNKLF